VPDGNGQPTISEMARRINYLEGRLDARTVSTEVWAAEKTTINVEITGIKARLVQHDDAISGAVKMIIGAFLGLVVQAIFLIVYLTSKGGGG
jgi:hypothetical protein